MGMSATWNDYFMGMARYVAAKSKDKSTRVGCVLVGPDNEIRSTGYNGMPRGVDDEVEARHERPDLWTEHAERNAVYNAARMGTALKGCRAYVSAALPCMDCARALVQAGIVEVVCDEPDAGMVERWGEQMERTRVLFAEAGVAIRIEAAI